jgi:hypothetical protein
MTKNSQDDMDKDPKQVQERFSIEFQKERGIVSFNNSSRQPLRVVARGWPIGHHASGLKPNLSEKRTALEKTAQDKTKSNRNRLIDR